MNSIDLSFAREVRRFLEPLWSEFKDSRNTSWRETEKLAHGMCRFTCAFALPILSEYSGRSLRPAGGFSDFHPADTGWNRTAGKPASGWNTLDGIGGMRDTDGIWRDHYWLTDGQVIVDLTADQFGWDGILMTDSADDRYVENWRESEVRKHMKSDITPRVNEWLSLWADRDCDPVIRSLA